MAGFLVAMSALGALAVWGLAAWPHGPGAAEVIEGREVSGTTGSAPVTDEPAPVRASVPARAAGSPSTPAIDRDAPDPSEDEALPDGARVLAGRLVLPLGAPREEGLRVLAIGRRFGDGRRERACELEPDGRFHAVFAPGTRDGLVQLDSRFLLLATHHVDLDDPPAELVLEPALGARVAGRVLPPLLREGEAPGFEAMMVFVGGRGWTPDAGGSFDVGPLRAEAVTFEVRSPAWVDERRELELVAGETIHVEVALERGVHLAGRVVGLDGAGIRNAELSARSEGHGVDIGSGLEVETRTESDGRFELRGLRAGEVKLEAGKRDYLPAQQSLGLLPDGAVRDGLVLRLDEGLALEGVVLWPDGRPAEGATVELTPSVQTAAGESKRGELRSQRADEAGAFRFAGLEPGACELRATARLEDEPGSSRGAAGPLHVAFVDELPAGTRGVELVLGEGERLHGRVVDEVGEPIEDFRVDAASVAGRGWGTFRVSERFERTDGRFELRGLHPGTWSVGAGAADHRASPERIVEVPGFGGELVLVLPRELRVAGIVRGPDGAPFPGARIWACVPGEGASGYAGGRTIDTSDARGRFASTELAAGTWLLLARAEGFAESAPVAVELAPGREPPPVELALRPGARIEGLLSLASGEIAGREIWIDSPGDTSVARTDEDGAFRFEGLAPGEHTLALALTDAERAGGHFASKIRAIVVLAEGETARVALPPPLVDALTVRGRVTSAGEPAAGYDIIWGSAGATTRTTRTDAEGRYVTGLERGGSWRVLVRLEGQILAVESVEVPERGLEHDVALPSGVVAGVVADGGGRGVEGVQVWLVAEDRESGRGARLATSVAAGRFHFEHVPPGRYELHAGGENLSIERDEDVPARCRIELELAGGERREDLSLTLVPGAVLRGRVRAAAGLSRTLRVELRRQDGQRLRSEPIELDGSFKVRGLTTESYLLVARDGETELGSLRVDVRAGEVTTVELALGG